MYIKLIGNKNKLIAVLNKDKKNRNSIPFSN